LRTEGGGLKVARPKRARPLREQGLDALRQALFTGKFQPGERITEEAVAEMLGVSRTPAREAINALGQQGVLEARPGGGFIFPSPSLAEIEDVFELRRILEPYAARKAIRQAGGKDVDTLRGIVDRQKELLGSGNAQRFFSLTLQFRRALFELAGNPRLATTIGQFMDHLYFVGILTLRERPVREVVIRGHERIIRALEARDEQAMEEAVLRHLEAAKTALMAVVRHQVSA
jgi:DNA-binding GntR family transcriptional regulator